MAVRLARWRIRTVPLIAFGLSLILAIAFGVARPAIPQTSMLSATPSTELRGVWLTNVDSDVMFSRSYLAETVQQLADLHLNTVYPAVWNWGYTTYPSAVAQRVIGHRVDPRSPGLQDRDMLAELVELGHQHKLAIVPWFEFGFMTTAESEIAQIHPEWVTQRRNGTEIWQEGIYQRRWLNPFRPEVQQFILDLIVELVTQYDIDGIQFDDHFGLPNEFGYDDFTVQLYQLEHDGASPPANPLDDEWVQWRANKITAFMTRVFQTIKAQNSDLTVALSPNTYYFSYHHSLQDWRSWERQGLIEELTLQVYRDNLNSFIAELERPEVQAARQHIPTAVGILTGLKDLPVPIQRVADQVQAVRQRNFAGVSLFFYETLWNLTAEQPDERQAVLETLFATPSTRPNLHRGWVAQPS